MIAIAFLVIVALIIFFASVKIVPESNEFIIERLGKYKKTLSAGVNIVVPFIDD